MCCVRVPLSTRVYAPEKIESMNGKGCICRDNEPFFFLFFFAGNVGKEAICVEFSVEPRGTVNATNHTWIVHTMRKNQRIHAWDNR